MGAVLLIDFGSTWTKLTAVSLASETLLGSATAFTTAEEDINIGLKDALQHLEDKIGPQVFDGVWACSSAAGGLRIHVSGLVPELTAEAARMAALGAGAKIEHIFSYELTKKDLALIEMNKPDIFLLVGGTDGGNKDCIVANAKKLAGLTVRFPIIYAGNRSALDECEEILSDFPLTVCPNVMPRFGELQTEDVQKEIRNLFLTQIIEAKGLTKTRSILSGILMPTPSAMLSAMKLLAEGTETERGIGPLMGIDVGGATTDVYSIADGAPRDVQVMLKGLPEPYVKRTVEGDIGMRHCIDGIVMEVGLEDLSSRCDLPERRVEELLELFNRRKDTIPSGREEEAIDLALASAAVDVATQRHSGKLQEVYTTSGLAYVQTGKDLRSLEQIVISGGALIHAKDPLKIAKAALYNSAMPASLRPLRAQVWRDSKYLLSAMGVLAEKEADIALRIMKRELENIGEITSGE
ncbi:MAG: methylaspartate mutase accessory protein GlmL [Eubacteriales bacterium]|nr:methylaspartate mutase accessory protein GlmL [Eubacteriales bacterium]